MTEEQRVRDAIVLHEVSDTLGTQAAQAMDDMLRTALATSLAYTTHWKPTWRQRLGYRIDRLLQPIHDKFFSRYCDHY